MLGRTREGHTLYLRHKGKRLSPDSDKTWEDYIVEDIAALHAAGVIHKAFPNVIAKLGIAHPELNATIEAARTSYTELFAAFKNKEAAAVAETLVDLTRKRYGEARTEFAEALRWLAICKGRLSSIAESQALHERSLLIYEQALGPEHPEVAMALRKLAFNAPEATAEPLYKRSISIYEKAHGPDSIWLAETLDELAKQYGYQKRYAEADPLSNRSLAIREKVNGSDHVEVGHWLYDLAENYKYQRREADAEPFLKRSLAIFEKALPDDPQVAEVADKLAGLYAEQKRHAEAEELYKRSVAIYEKARGADDFDVGKQLVSLTLLYMDQGRMLEAGSLSWRVLGIMEKGHGAEHPAVGVALRLMAELYEKQGQYDEAEPHLRRRLDINMKNRPEEVGNSLDSLGWNTFSQNNWPTAADYWRRSVGAIKGGLLSAAYADDSRRRFLGLIRASHRVDASAPAAIAEAFETVQRAAVRPAASSLGLMAARYGTRKVAALLREQQDLTREYLNTFEAPAKSTPEIKNWLAGRLAEIDSRLDEIKQILARDFPDYAEVSGRAWLSVSEVQALLGADEAVVLFLDLPEWKPAVEEETFVWVVTKSDVRWVRSELGSEALKREVQALRCGLDHALWYESVTRERCVELSKALRSDGAGVPTVLPFDAERAHALYKSLFGQVEDLIAGKHLLIVPSGALTQLPFQVLVTGPDNAAPTSGDAQATPNSGGATVSDAASHPPLRAARVAGAIACGNDPARSLLPASHREEGRPPHAGAD